MYRTIAIALLLALIAPLGAQSLMERLFEGSDADDVGRDWYRDMQDYIFESCESAPYPWTWFKDESGAPQRYEIQAADQRTLTLQLLAATGETDKEGNPVRVPFGEKRKVQWREWETPYIVMTYPTANNDDDGDLVAFACWLYTDRVRRKTATMLANRLLTIVHERSEDLRAPIEAFVREQEKLDDDTELAVIDMWDDLFQVHRSVLIPADDAEKIKKQREDAAKTTFTDLKRQAQSADKRTLTLAALKFELTKWTVDFKDTDYGAAKVEDAQDLIEVVDSDLAKVETLIMTGDALRDKEEPDWEKAGADYARALALDPASKLLLSKAANAKLQQTELDFQSSKNRWVGNYHIAEEAIALFDKWLEVEPANGDVIWNLATLHHMRQENKQAREYYDSIKELEPGTRRAKNAQRFIDVIDEK